MTSEKLLHSAQQEIDRTPPEMQPDEITEDASLTALTDLLRRLAKGAATGSNGELVREIAEAKTLLLQDFITV